MYLFLCQGGFSRPKRFFFVPNGWEGFLSFQPHSKTSTGDTNSYIRLHAIVAACQLSQSSIQALLGLVSPTQSPVAVYCREEQPLRLGALCDECQASRWFTELCSTAPLPQARLCRDSGGVRLNFGSSTTVEVICVRPAVVTSGGGANRRAAVDGGHRGAGRDKDAENSRIP